MGAGQIQLARCLFGAEQPGAGMSREFDSRADSIVAGEGILFPDNQDPSDTALLAQAPGYSIFLSAIYALNGRSYFTVQLVQNAINSVSPVLLFLIAGNLVSWRVGVVSGLLAAVSHHLSYYSNLVLSDSLCALPVLISVSVLLPEFAVNARAPPASTVRFTGFGPTVAVPNFTSVEFPTALNPVGLLKVFLKS